MRAPTLVALALLSWGCADASEDAAADDKAASTPDDDGNVDCQADLDGDGDGLDDCTEEELGTDPAQADTDGDGYTDAEELDCVSNPLDGDEPCYACGWAHNDPGSLEATGADIGDTVANLSLVDQCGDTVDLWDFSGSYTVAFITAAWCPLCKDEAAALASEVADLSAATGQSVQGVIVLFEGRTAGVPTIDDVIPYAEEVGAVDVPVLGDVNSAALASVPFDGAALPGVCLLDPSMNILACGSGQGQVPGLADIIADHQN